MTVCNMTIEAAGVQGWWPDDTTFEWFERGARPGAPSGSALEEAIASWRTLVTDDDARFDARWWSTPARSRHSHWGRTRGWSLASQAASRARQLRQPADREAAARALHYMGLEAGVPIQELTLDRVFIGSCTNSRSRPASCGGRGQGRRVSSHVKAMVVPVAAGTSPGRGRGHDQVFRDAGFDWRTAAARCVSG